MKRNCYGCRANAYDSCSLGYGKESIELRGKDEKFYGWTKIPKEQCPKPLTYAALDVAPSKQSLKERSEGK
jgi:hypothetical protein